MSLLPYNDDSPIGPRCTWCALEPATTKCHDCEEGSNMYCVACANGVHVRENFRNHNMSFINSQEPVPKHAPTINNNNSLSAPLGSPVPPPPPPVYYHNTPDRNAPHYFGAPEVIDPGTYIPLQMPPGPLYPPLQPYQPPPQPVYQLPPQAQSQPQVRPTNRQQEIQRHVTEATPLVAKNQSSKSVTPPTYGSLVFLMVLVILLTAAGKVFFESYAIVNSSSYEDDIFYYAVAMSSPFPYVIVSIVMFVFGIIYLLFVCSFRDFVDCLWKPLLLLPPALISAYIFLQWWACGHTNKDYPEYVCTGPYNTFRYPMQLIVLSVLSVLFERKKSSAGLATLASFTLVVGYVMLFWDQSMKEKSNWQSPLAPTIVNIALLLLFPIYLGSIRLALRFYTVNKVWVSQSLWVGVVCASVFFGWHPDWTISYKDLFSKNLMIPLTAGSLLIAVFMMALLLIVCYGTALTGAFHAVYASALSFVILVLLQRVGYTWELFSTNDLFNGDQWDWTSFNIAGAVIAGFSLVVFFPVYFTWRVKPQAEYDE
eukprot:TRINITY_DN265_c0_g1_i1.p1 TRINITY_DN265_c0_g1~~TRINITY_DN265_c0_g1_i1.p1  ORF type:complete len:539 (-),score=84.23 TRINITY_DN265_c0_g1_i1:200-1816(-)